MPTGQLRDHPTTLARAPVLVYIRRGQPLECSGRFLGLAGRWCSTTPTTPGTCWSGTRATSSNFLLLSPRPRDLRPRPAHERRRVLASSRAAARRVRRRHGPVHRTYARELAARRPARRACRQHGADIAHRRRADPNPCPGLWTFCRCTKGHDASTHISAPASGWLTTGRGPELPGETALRLPVHAAR